MNLRFERLNEKTNDNENEDNQDVAFYGRQHTRVFNSNNVVFTSFAAENNSSNDMCIFDSGSSCHYCQSLEGLTDGKGIGELIKIGDGRAMRACKTGNMNL